MKEASKRWQELAPEKKAEFLNQAKALKEDELAQQQEMAKEDAQLRAKSFVWESNRVTKVQFKVAPGQDGDAGVTQVTVWEEKGADVVETW